MELQGDYNSNKAQVLKLVFEKCNNETIEGNVTCASDEEITVWLRRKFIIVLQNQVRFQTFEYNENRIVNESKLFYYPIDR